ncbi:MAG: hypothetical protein HC888_03290 [Candidatus Competibacteraceae bacterium]|nr:hypothetical protein [Candidatus Competibacteraceae bacterium]
MKASELKVRMSTMLVQEAKFMQEEIAAANKKAEDNCFSMGFGSKETREG